MDFIEIKKYIDDHVNDKLKDWQKNVFYMLDDIFSTISLKNGFLNEGLNDPIFNNPYLNEHIKKKIIPNQEKYLKSPLIKGWQKYCFEKNPKRPKNEMQKCWD